MKRIFVLLLIFSIVLTGCGNIKIKDIKKEIIKKYDKSNGYQMEGVLTIYNNDDVYHYDVVSSYKKDHFYHISILNQNNDFKQIILKNDDGVFLYTPSLNRSFKFQSDWPYKNSQIYLLDAIMNDLENDKDSSFLKKNDSYIVSTKVHYPNNSSFSSQKIVFNSDYKIKKITVYDSNEKVCMEFQVNRLTFSPKFSKNFFQLDTIQSDNSQTNEEESDDSEVKETGTLEDVIYPLFVPSGTKLVDEEKVLKDSGERVIMTYDGEKSFLLVEETQDVFQEFTIIPSTGEPFQLMDTIGVMTDNSLSWSSGNTEYYLVSDVMSQNELIEVAQSIVGITSLK